MSEQGRFDIALENGAVVRVQVVLPQVFRVRMRADGEFEEPGLVRYGVVKSEWPEVPVSVTGDDGVLVFDTGEAQLEVSKLDGRVALYGAGGEEVLRQVEAPVSEGDEGGFRAEFGLADGVRLYGLGDETRDRINKRGHKTQMVLRNVVSYVPIPFLMSTGGWAIFMNSTWFHQLDLGATVADRLVYSARRGELDYYLIAGETLPVLLDRYTQVSGRPVLLPQWGYGLTFVCDERGVRARDVLYEALEFRREKVPCDLIGLEPDWMETRYDFSVDKQWSTERFHQPFWKQHQEPGGFVAGLNNMGFKLSLWLCVDYDVSEYEEQMVRENDATDGSRSGERSYRETEEDRYDEDIIKDPHFVPSYQDKITKRGEPWFEHLKKFVDNGAAAFKLDGSNQICFHPDRKWLNGMDDEEMHNLYPVLMAKQMAHGFRDHTGKRAMIYTAGGYAGTQQYAATWAGDTGGGQKPLVCTLNHALSGHSNTSCDMQVWNVEGIHFGFLQAWSQVLSWHMYNQPWFLKPEIYEVFKSYARLRYRLLPYLYSMAHVAARTGMPVVRPMPLVMPEDPRCDELLSQYMLGESFLTCSFTNTIYLPEGRWVDYWTGEGYEGGQEIEYAVPEGKGGPLFVKAGAIIPTWPEIDYVGQRAMETVGLEVYPWEDSRFTLYEDDGETFGYLEGKVATTEVECQAEAGRVVVKVGPRVGDYEGKSERRVWEVGVHLEGRPSRVTVDGADAEWAWEEEGTGARAMVEEKAEGVEVVLEG
ncbi:MAG: TIM-barrel domain-containing protein [Armatimonadia bacterium]